MKEKKQNEIKYSAFNQALPASKTANFYKEEVAQGNAPRKGCVPFAFQSLRVLRGTLMR